MIGWILTRLNWSYLASWAAETFIPVVTSIQAFLGLSWTTFVSLLIQIPWPSMDWAIFGRIQSLVIAKPELVVVAIVSGVALILISTVDNLIAGQLTGRR